MTNVKCENDRGTYHIDIEGHANYSEGVDILCSAISTLGFTLMNAISNKDTEHCHIDYAEGEVHMRFKPTKESKEAVNTIVETIMMGFEMLSDKYPANVTLQWD